MEDATNEPFLTKSNVRACGESGKPASNRRKKPSQTREGVESPMDTGVQDAPDPGTSRHIQCRKTQCFPRSRAGSNPVGDASFERNVGRLARCPSTHARFVADIDSSRLRVIRRLLEALNRASELSHHLREG